MPDCDYCGEAFSDETTYLNHLQADHETAELSRIDQRRVETEVGGSGGGLPVGPLVLGGLVVVALAATVYVTFFFGGGSTGSALGAVQQTPTDVGSVHEHGSIDVTIAGEALDFSRSEFQNPRQYSAFHFEGGDGEVWHKHGRGVTLGYAMSTLGIEVNRTAVEYDGRTYRDSDPGTTVTVEVNGEPVDPSTYELQGSQSESNVEEGDHIRIVVRTDG
jgi:hypothetical protein